LTLEFLVTPGSTGCRHREIAQLIGTRSTPIVRIVVPTIIELGFLRRTVFEPIKSIDAVIADVMAAPAPVARSVATAG
jgi:hypothetical protein